MKKVKFSVICRAVYQSELLVPDDAAKDTASVLNHIRNSLPECNVNDIEFLSDIEPEEAVTLKDIISIEDVF